MHKSITFATAVAVLATPVLAKDQDKKTIMARNASEAASMKLADEDAGSEICVRQLQINSRTKYRKVCMNQVAWQAYADSLEQMGSDWRRAGVGTTEQ